jgi:hypothetical protein
MGHHLGRIDRPTPSARPGNCADDRGRSEHSSVSAQVVNDGRIHRYGRLRDSGEEIGFTADKAVKPQNAKLSR